MKSLLFAALFLSAIASQAQVAWIDPPQVSPNQPVTLYVNVAQTSCPNLANADVYLWTWNPSENLITGGNGTWDNSNPLNKMTDQGNGIFSYTFAPSMAAFYNVTPEQVIMNGLNFLVKRKNGNEAGVCSGEAKSEDLYLPLAAAATQNLLPADQLRLSPNPVNDRLDITFSEAVQNDNYLVELFDMTGRLALSQAWTGQSLPLGALANGQYLVRVTGDAGVWAKRIVKQ